MILTFFYAYATVMQWWRLGNLKTKLCGTLNHQNALVVANAACMYDPRNKWGLENLLFQNENRICCTVVPKQTVNLAQWAAFPKDQRYFPIYISTPKLKLQPPSLHVRLEAVLNSYVPHHSDILQVESFGEPIAWKAVENFELILKTDFDNLTKLVQWFCYHGVDINHELHLLKLETVDVEGSPTKIKYEKIYSNEERLKYSYSAVPWGKFADDVISLYKKIHEVKNPKITIENGLSAEENKKVPVYEVKPIKKTTDTESKNKLDVAGGDCRRPRTKESLHKPRSEHKSKSKSKESESRQLKTKKKSDEARTKEVEVQAAVILNSVIDEADRKVNGTPDLKVEVQKPRKAPRKLSRSASSVPTKYSKNLNRNVKPPVVLVYADSAIAKESVKQVLHDILNRERYTVYDLPPATGNNPVWTDCTDLIVVCGNVNQNLTNQLLQYLVNGGQLLCLCSDLLYSVLHTFTTAEVREHELVRFSYGDWKRVKMMHHIFCYQASPAKKQFSKDSDHSTSSSNGNSPVAPRTPSTVDIQHNGKTYTIQVQVLGAEETWQTPSLLLATVKNSQGKAIFSQVHLEIDPMQYEDDEDKFAALKESNNTRLEILKHILSQHLDMDCTNTGVDPALTPGYFLGKHELKRQLLQECESIKDHKLVTDKITVVFCGKDVEPGTATESYLPVILHGCPPNFSTVQFFETLDTEHVGRLVIYVDVLTSSKSILDRKLEHGLAVIPRIQTKGSVGRATNTWISPPGSAMFSLQLHITLDSPLGKALPLVQHMIMVSVVSAIRSIPGYEKLGLGLKWPNDLYTTVGVKVGGLVVTSSVTSGVAIANAGVGVDLDNVNPTMCINELIRLHNEEYKTNLQPIGYEQYFALVFNEIERIFKRVQDGDIDYLYDLYYKYWLHSGAEITVQTVTGESRKAVITGVDDYGFLTVQSEDGTLSSVQPDGNTFDMLKGLIAPKIF